MGYNTRYKLNLAEVSVNEIVKIEAAMKAFEPDYGEGWLFDIYCGDADVCKWYEHEVEMKDFSSMFPTALFVLTGEGEEPGDLWIKYFKDGKMQECRGIIIYLPYDERKLK